MEAAIVSQSADNPSENDPRMKAFLGQVEVLSTDCVNAIFKGTAMPR